MTRKEIKASLQAAGRWEDYKALRERLKQNGMVPAEASKEALRQIEGGECLPHGPDANESSSEESEPEREELVIIVTKQQRDTYIAAATNAGLSLFDWVEKTCDGVAKVEGSVAPSDGRCARCKRVGRAECPACPKNSICLRALSVRQSATQQRALAEAVRHVQQLRERVEELEGKRATKESV
jgi:hypothetical protein